MYLPEASIKEIRILMAIKIKVTGSKNFLSESLLPFYQCIDQEYYKSENQQCKQDRIHHHI
jgi:hypothetical protein